jgi:hypothetical protein
MADDAPRPTIVRWGILALALLGLAVGGWYVFLHEESGESPPDSQIPPDPPPPDPRLTYETPFRNVKPHVRYVGDQACAGCHADIDKSYHAHPMGRSADFVAKAPPIERYDSSAHNPCTVGPYELFVEKVGDKVLHRVRAKDSNGKPLPDYVTTAHLAIGSGTRGRSYVSIENGAAWQTPISWYSPDVRWDLSPGFDLGRNGGRRGIVPDCLYCHVNHVEPVPHAANRYREPLPVGQTSIGCERCHGPGELHVAERTAGPIGARIDTSIVNPKHLSPELRAGICAQCHLQGEERIARRGRDIFEYRPGLPLELFVTVFVRHPSLVDYQKSVGQFEQMHRSRCFTESKGLFGCTSCHDAHAAPAAATKDVFYNGRCQNCHGKDSVVCSEKPAARQAKGDNCIACHMPRKSSSNIVHASVTDHRVPRRPIPSTGSRGLNPGDTPIVAFPVGNHPISQAELNRDYGIGLSRLIANIGSDPIARNMVGALAERELAVSVATWRGDLPAWIGLGFAREARGDTAGFLEAATSAAMLAPDSEVAQNNLANASAAAGDIDAAIAAATKLIAMSPTRVEPLLLRAGINLKIRAWARAEADCRAALAIHPLLPQARMVLAICRYHLGDIDGAQTEAETAIGLAIKPEQKASLRELFRAQTR